MPTEAPSRRFAAKLLFQCRVAEGKSRKRRLCEERIINFTANGPRDAVRRTRQIAKKAEHDYIGGNGDRVFWEFVGIVDIQELSPQPDEYEVWTELKRMMTPMERRDSLLPTEETLLSRLQ